MFMTPDDKVEKVVQERLWNVVGEAVLRTILVQHHQVEPVFSVLPWSQHPHLAVPEQPEVTKTNI